MEGKDKADTQNDRESTSKKEDTSAPKNEQTSVAPTQNDAGPSSKITLPGTIESMKYNPLKPGLSKSEHNIRHIITAKDVTNALNMASLSFGTKLPVNMAEIRIPLPEIRIPLQEVQENVEKTVPNELKSLVELQKFMESCLKTKDGNNILNTAINLKEVNIQNIKVPLPNLPTLQELPNSSCISDNIQTDCAPVNLPNALLNPNVLEPKLSKSDKKKTSGSLSERSDFPVAQRDSLSSIGSNVCRICMTRGKERLISPCNCKGSLANVHLSCLERWLNQVGRNHCELCGFRLKHGSRPPRLVEEGNLTRSDIQRSSVTRLYRAYLECLVRNGYPAIRTPRYTVLQALRLWFGNPRNRSHLQSDCLIFWLLSTVTAGLLAVCIVGTQYFVIEGNKFGKQDGVTRKGEGISHRITETAMDFFMAIVLCGYSVTVYLLWKDHYVMWNRWRRANVNVRLLLTPDANPVPFVPNPRYSMV